MKYVVILILTLTSFALKAQEKFQFLFYDPCSKQTLALDYELWYHDSTIQIKAEQTVSLNQEYYLLSTQLKTDNNDWIGTFSFDIYTKNIGTSDTLYLDKLRPMWNGLLHPQKVEFYNCYVRCDGKVEVKDSRGTVRASGRFHNGIPASNIKFFDKQGQLREKWIYSNGTLKRIKKTEPNMG